MHTQSSAPRSVCSLQDVDSVERLKRMPCARRGRTKHMKASRTSPRGKEIDPAPATKKPVVSSVINMTQNFEHLFLATFFSPPKSTCKANISIPLSILLPHLFCYTPCTPLHTMTCLVFKIVVLLICYLFVSMVKIFMWQE